MRKCVFWMELFLRWAMWPTGLLLILGWFFLNQGCYFLIGDCFNWCCFDIDVVLWIDGFKFGDVVLNDFLSWRCFRVSFLNCGSFRSVLLFSLDGSCLTQTASGVTRDLEVWSTYTEMTVGDRVRYFGAVLGVDTPPGFKLLRSDLDFMVWFELLCFKLLLWDKVMILFDMNCEILSYLIAYAPFVRRGTLVLT